MVSVATAIALALIEDAKDGVKAVIAMLVFVGLFLFALGVMTSTFKDALNYNPYHKEYVYHMNPNDSTKILVDSIYIKTKK